jgi:hypothetical protein
MEYSPKFVRTPDGIVGFVAFVLRGVLIGEGTKGS